MNKFKKNCTGLTSAITCVMFAGFVLMYSIGFVSEAEAAGSIIKRIGPTDWRLTLKNFTVTIIDRDSAFSLSIADGRYLNFLAQKRDTPRTSRFGPLKKEYTNVLGHLMAAAAEFSGQPPGENITIGIHWRHYPEHITRWALEWQDSHLQKNWHKLDRHNAYNALTQMMSQFICKEFADIVSDLGYRPQSASMEKMTYPKAKSFPFFETKLKPDRIKPHMAIPTPLMTYLLLSASGSGHAARPRLSLKNRVDGFFITAKKAKATLYCSFIRALDEFSISGDTRKEDNRFHRIMPMASPQYRAMAAQLLKAGIDAVSTADPGNISIRLDPSSYPDLYRAMVTSYPSIKEAQKVNRPGQSRQFYTFKPDPSQHFFTETSAFSKYLEMEISHFEVHFSTTGRAGACPEYKRILAPMGIKAEDSVPRPDIVYMVLTPNIS